MALTRSKASREQRGLVGAREEKEREGGRCGGMAHGLNTLYACIKISF